TRRMETAGRPSASARPIAAATMSSRVGRLGCPGAGRIQISPGPGARWPPRWGCPAAAGPGGGVGLGGMRWCYAVPLGRYSVSIFCYTVSGMWDTTGRCPPPAARRNSARRQQRQGGPPMTLATFDRQEVHRFAQAFEELFYRGDAATMTSFYT